MFALDLTSGDTVYVDNIPSEVVNGAHFEFYYPSGRTCEFMVKGLSGEYTEYASLTTETNVTISGIQYVKLCTAGAYQGGSTSYKFVFDKALIEN